MKLSFKKSTMDAVMDECRRSGTPVTTFINQLVDAEADRIRANNQKLSIEGEKSAKGIILQK